MVHARAGVQMTSGNTKSDIATQICAISVAAALIATAVCQRRLQEVMMVMTVAQAARTINIARRQAASVITIRGRINRTTILAAAVVQRRLQVIHRVLVLAIRGTIRKIMVLAS